MIREGSLIYLRGETWRIVHVHYQCHIYTLERARRWFKGRYWPLTGEALHYEATTAQTGSGPSETTACEGG